jgi:hypothetical protein
MLLQTLLASAVLLQPALTPAPTLGLQLSALLVLDLLQAVEAFSAWPG